MLDRLRKVACVIGVWSIAFASADVLDKAAIEFEQEHESMCEKHEWIFPAMFCLVAVSGLCIGKYAGDVSNRILNDI